MSSDEPKIRPTEHEGEAAAEAVAGDLRRQIRAARRRLDEHRRQMEAVGLRPRRTGSDGASDPTA